VRGQQRPDLSGEWVRIEQPKGVSSLGPYASALTVKQTAEAITLDVLTAYFSFGSTGSRREIAKPVTYTTDGTDHKVEIDVPTSNLATVSATRTVDDRLYRAVYGREQLVIVTHETYTIRVPGKEPLRNRRMIRDALRLEQDGRLTVERFYLSDPLPPGFYFGSSVEEPTPTPLRVVYQRK
jgi:hypothetical protein